MRTCIVLSIKYIISMIISLVYNHHILGLIFLAEPCSAFITVIGRVVVVIIVAVIITTWTVVCTEGMITDIVLECRADASLLAVRLVEHGLGINSQFFSLMVAMSVCVRF